MSDILLNFEDGLGSYLTKEQLKEQAPLVFADAPTNPDVSKKYLFVNTETIIDDLFDPRLMARWGYGYL